MKHQWVVVFSVLIFSFVSEASEVSARYCHDNQNVYYKTSNCEQNTCWQQVEAGPLREVEVIWASEENHIYRFHLNPLLTQIPVCSHTEVLEPDFVEYERRAYFDELNTIHELLQKNIHYIGMLENRSEPSQSLREGNYIELSHPDSSLFQGIYGAHPQPQLSLTAGGEFGGGGASADSTSLNRIGISIPESEVEKWRPEPKKDDEDSETEGTDI